MKKKIIKKIISNTIKGLAVILGFVGILVILGAVGTSDYETMVTKVVVHSTADIMKMALCGFAIIFAGVGTYNVGKVICKEEEDLYDLL